MKKNIKKVIDELVDEKKKTIGFQLKKNEACKLSIIKTQWNTIINQCKTLKVDIDGNDSKAIKEKTAKTLALIGKSAENINDSISNLADDCKSKCSKIYKLVSDLLNKLTDLINKLNSALDADKSSKKSVLNLGGLNL